MSVATEAFAWALGELAATAPEVTERRPAYDVWTAGEQPVVEDVVAPAPDTIAAMPPLAGGGRIAAAAEKLRAGAVSCVELTREALAAIERDSARLTAFVEVCGERALAAAELLDRELREHGPRGPLHGIPVSVKDVIHVAGLPTRAGSDAYEVTPEHDAWAVARLRAAGAVILGKTATHEFALGVTSPQSRNPHDDTRIPGGSSGGSAVAVATGMGMASLATDTRASTRVPAALCGVVGIKPTYGVIPTDGVVPLSWTMDHLGVLAPGVYDAAVVLDVLTGGAHGQAAPGAGDAVAGLKLGLPPAAWEGAQPEVAAAVDAAVGRLAGHGVVVREVDRPSSADFDDANALGLVVSRCEAAAFHRGLGADRDLYWSEVRDQLNAADAVLAVDYIDAQRRRVELRERMLAALDGLDALAMPTSLVVAPPADQAEEYLTVLSRNAILWSFVGFPVISAPCRPTTPGGLPVGLQLVARPHAERTLVALARALEARAG